MFYFWVELADVGHMKFLVCRNVGQMTSLAGVGMGTDLRKLFAGELQVTWQIWACPTVPAFLMNQKLQQKHAGSFESQVA